MGEKPEKPDPQAVHVAHDQELIEKAEAERLKLRTTSALCREHCRALGDTIDRIYSERL